MHLILEATARSCLQEDVPFEELAVRRAGGGKAWPSGRGGSVGRQADAKPKSDKKPAALAHRENKNRPAEASSKRPIGRMRDVMQAPKLCVVEPMQ